MTIEINTTFYSFLSYILIAIAFIVITICDRIICSRRRALSIKVIVFGILTICPLLILLDIPIYNIDKISAFFSLLAGFIGIATSIYVEGYNVYKYVGRDLKTLIDLFALATYGTFSSPHVGAFVIWWLLAETLGFYAIIFEGSRETFTAGLRYLVASMVPADITLLTLLALAAYNWSPSEAFTRPIADVSTLYIPEYLAIIVLLGFMAKAAVAPLHFWLPDAHSLAPAPASAILSGILVKMGIYGIVRLLNALDFTATLTALVFSSITIIYGGLQALMQRDIKRILAYSTIENTSLMTFGFMFYRIFGVPELYMASLMLVAAHSLFKAALFIDSGTVEIVFHTRDLSKLGQVSKAIPNVSGYALISLLSLWGVPPLIGFLAKLYLIMGLVTVSMTNPLAGIGGLIVVSIAIVLAIAYGMQYLSVHWGSITIPQSAHPISDRRLYIGEALLSTLSLVLSPFILYTVNYMVLHQIIDLITLTQLLVAIVIIYITTFSLYRIKGTLKEEEVWVGGTTV